MTAAPFHQDPQVVQGFLLFSRIVAVLMCAMALQQWLDLRETMTFALMAVFTGGAVAWLI